MNKAMRKKVEVWVNEFEEYLVLVEGDLSSDEVKALELLNFEAYLVGYGRVFYTKSLAISYCDRVAMLLQLIN